MNEAIIDPRPVAASTMHAMTWYASATHFFGYPTGYLPHLDHRSWVTV